MRNVLRISLFDWNIGAINDVPDRRTVHRKITTAYVSAADTPADIEWLFAASVSNENYFLSDYSGLKTPPVRENGNHHSGDSKPAWTILVNCF